MTIRWIIAAQPEATLCTEAGQLARLIEALAVALVACPPKHRQRCSAAHKKLVEAVERLGQIIKGRPSEASIRRVIAKRFANGYRGDC
jgi:hypothetical protein